MDLAEDAVAEANQRYSAIANFHVGSMGELPFQDGSFDVVACLEGIEHVPKDVADQFLAESFRVLSAGGRLLISSPHTTSGEHSGNEFHIYEYPTEEIREKLTTHFSIEDFHQRNVDNLVVDYFVCQKS